MFICFNFCINKKNEIIRDQEIKLANKFFELKEVYDQDFRNVYFYKIYEYTKDNFGKVIKNVRVAIYNEKLDLVGWRIFEFEDVKQSTIELKKLKKEN